MRPQLKNIADDLTAGRMTPAVTTREFLSWFNAKRRGYWIVRDIRKELEEASIQTVPDFESAYIDSPIELRAVASAVQQSLTPPSDFSGVNQAAHADPESTAQTSALISKDPTFRISKLDVANQTIVSVRPDAGLKECVTIMMSRDFSQLPVMTSDRTVLGMVTWKTIGSRLALSDSAEHAKDLMIKAHDIRSDSSIFEAIPTIASHDYVLVRGDDNRITGIITATDLSLQFRVLSEPFLLLAEVENLVRTMIADKFDTQELAAARVPSDNARPVTGPADLTFGEYIRLLQNADRWKKFGIAIDRVEFCKGLDTVRQIRNDVMHFDPDGIVEDQLKTLRDFTSFLKELQSIMTR
jgi:predicted transcriptional regulator